MSGIPVNAPPTSRLKIAIRGAVQGVGFRPFAFRLAGELKLSGWVNNSSRGVFIEVEGPRPALEQFLLRLEKEKPPRSYIQSLEASWLEVVGYNGVEIRESDAGGDKTAIILPDIATCPDCLREINDPRNRRYRYPFTNCTHCGPRFTIIEALPYDRANTSMKKFTMCLQCQAEYDNPADRRFHAQPNACPVCGPHLEFWDSRTDVALLGGNHRNAGSEGKVGNYARPLIPAFSPGGGEGGRRPVEEEDSLFQSYLQGSVAPGSDIPKDSDALLAAANAIREGKIVAVKGLGGFHLMADARNDEAVRLLRQRKHREEKPFALMFPSLESVKAACEVSPLEERLLHAPESPIVLLKKTANGKSQIADSTAPRNPYLGAMLPYTPLHHLLLAELGFPVIATSGNLSDEPICTDEHEALERLRDIADVFLVHNRPIVRHVDDSIVRVVLDREMVMRRARGYSSLPIQLNENLGTRQPPHPGPLHEPGNVQHSTFNVQHSMKERNSGPSHEFPSGSRFEGQGEVRDEKVILAVGAHLKNTIALAIGPQVFISQHIGDLETEQAHQAFRRVIADFEKLYEAKPQIIAADLHPDYLSTKFAREIHGARHVGVQHHIAHVLSCMAENEIAPPVLGVSWDGTGYGTDGTVWGGEFFLVTDEAVERVAHLRPFRLPGGEQAVKEPRRTALGLLHEIFCDAVFERKELAPVAAFRASELAALKTMLAKNLNSPVTTSAGRLFDAVASLAGLRQETRFEGQSAMELEFAIGDTDIDEAYLFNLKSGTPVILDWSPMVDAILTDIKQGVKPGMIAAKFHNALAEAIVQIAQYFGEWRIALSGGCFQNRYLTQRAVRRLQAEGFQPCWHQRVPPNDGGIALGQVIAALRAKG
jgi:hydrogenase maturation protein HypF